MRREYFLDFGILSFRLFVLDDSHFTIELVIILPDTLKLFLQF